MNQYIYISSLISSLINIELHYLFLQMPMMHDTITEQWNGSPKSDDDGATQRVKTEEE